MAYLTAIQLSILALVVGSHKDNAHYSLEYLVSQYKFESVMIIDLVQRGLIYTDLNSPYSKRALLLPTSKGTNLINQLLMLTIK